MLGSPQSNVYVDIDSIYNLRFNFYVYVYV